MKPQNSGGWRNGVDITLLAGLAVLFALACRSAWLAQDAVDRIWRLDFSPDARYLAVGSDSGTTLYETGAGAPLVQHIPSGRRVAFSADGKMAAVSSPQEIVILENASGQPRRQFQAEGDWTTTVAFSPDSRRLAALAESSNWLRLWDVETGRLLWEVEAHEDASFGLAFSPAGDLIATGGHRSGVPGHEIRFRETGTGKPRGAIDSGDHAHVRAIHFLTDRSSLMVVLSDGEPNRVWDIADLQAPRPSAHPLLSTLRGAAVMSPDGRYVATQVSSDDIWSLRVAVHELQDGRKVFETPARSGLFWGAGFLPGNAGLATATSLGALDRWDLQTGGLQSSHADFRPSIWRSSWTALSAAGGLWAVLWMLGYRGGAPAAGARFREKLLGLLTALPGSLIVIALHWIQVVDPPSSPDPLDFLETILGIGILSALGLAGMAAAGRSWAILAAILVVSSLLLSTTASLWIAITASV